MKKISLKKLLKLKNINLIDVRNQKDFLNYNINFSINIPFIELYNNYHNYLNINEKYYIICEGGYQSKKICKHLIKKGYNVIHVKRGIKNLYKLNF